ncbi:MAG: glycerol-3-phosphate acyltransferase [Chloroflexi bacterium]|nr:glycerol-3-phosphate acyltransferase [Chloroflexota bacterium]
MNANRASRPLGAPAAGPLTASRQTVAGARVGDSRHRGRDGGRQDSQRTDAGAPSRDDAIVRGVAACLAGYLYGSLPFVYLLGRRHGTDLHGVGSGNVGSANLWASTGTAYGALGWILDASKGGLPVALGRRLGCTESWVALAGVCGVAGQCWPLASAPLSEPPS